MSSPQTVQVVQGTTAPATSQPPAAAPAPANTAPLIQPPAQGTTAAQLAVTYQLPAQPVQQPAQIMMAQPAQAPMQPVMMVQGQQFQQQPVHMQVAQPVPVQMPQQVPAQPMQYVQPYYQPLASGSVAYTTQPQPGMPQVVMNPGYFNQPNYIYTPNSYFVLTLVLAIIFGIFSPLSLTCSLPALFFSYKSKQSSNAGNIKQAKSEGLTALGLIITAVLFALIVATVFTGVFVALGRSLLFRPYYYYG